MSNIGDKIRSNFDFKSLECNISIMDFNGSFDLLVALVKERKMDIMTLNLVEITKQYIDFVNNNIASIKIDDLTEYLLLASYLLELKSKKALPVIDTVEKLNKEIERDKFIQRLLVYKQYQNIVPQLMDKLEIRYKMHDKETYDLNEYINEESKNSNFIPQNIDINKILKAMQKVYIKLENMGKPKSNIAVIDVSEISIDVVENDIKLFLENYDFNTKITLDDYIASIPDEKFSKQYFVVAFVAILVLVRNGYILIEQPEDDDQIYIIKNKLDEGENEH
ncbi:segregation and condensation protein A [Malacoplasma muris]|uniref:segregation and condensation protein A n=1 Tax=Malacoplasma muris TaxID=2119 RepID=UPI00398EC5BD